MGGGDELHVYIHPEEFVGLEWFVLYSCQTPLLAFHCQFPSPVGSVSQKQHYARCLISSWALLILDDCWMYVPDSSFTYIPSFPYNMILNINENSNNT